ncbi:MAG TPA: site-specific integrase [Chthoniobacterales bacterium]
MRKGLNGAGQTMWIVDLRPHGKRKYFSSKDAALGEAQIQRIRLRNEGTEGLEFTPDQRTDARAAMTVLAGSGLSLTQAAKIAEEFHGIRTSGIALNDAVAALLKAKNKRSERYKKDLRLKLKKFSEDFPGRKLAEISVKEIKSWLKKRGAPVTNNNYRTALSVLFSHAKTEEWIASNPIEYVAAEEDDDTKQPGILELFQVRALLKACVEFQPDFVPAVTIALFGGVRPESELWHLHRQHVDLKKAEIDVHKSKSQGSTRFLKIQLNLVAWLQRYLKDEPGPISPHGDAFYSRLQRIRAEAGIIKWPQDVLRHSFASYRYAACNDENLTRKEMGHYGDVHLFLRDYKNRVRDENATEFWAITPNKIR